MEKEAGSANRSAECTSREDYISRIEDLNKEIREGEIDSSKLMVGSLDVEALYPSIRVKEATEIIRKKMENTDVKVDGVDYRWALIYLKLTCTKAEIVDNNLQGILPRKIKKGRKATILTVEEDARTERWWYPHSPPLGTADR